MPASSWHETFDSNISTKNKLTFNHPIARSKINDNTPSNKKNISKNNTPPDTKKCIQNKKLTFNHPIARSTIKNNTSS